MALKGNLRDFPITQLLNLVRLARKTGMLVVDGSAESVQVCFRDGRLACARVDQVADDLISVLQKQRKLSTAQSRALQRRNVLQPDKQLGLLLINANYFTQQEILSALQNHYAETLQRIFSWTEGEFHFENECPPPEDKIPIRMGLESLILESTRRLREAEQLQEEIPNLEAVLRFAERPGTNIRRMSLKSDEWRVISFINARNTLQQICQAAQISDLQMRRIVYGLLQAGIVELIAPSHRPPASSGQPARQSQSSTQSIPERKSLINRLITHIRSI